MRADPHWRTWRRSDLELPPSVVLQCLPLFSLPWDRCGYSLKHCPAGPALLIQPLRELSAGDYYRGMAAAPDTREPYRITDSPWLWALLFSLMSLVGIGLIAPKFDVRQRQIEGRFLGRQQSAIERSRRSAGLPPIDLATEAQDREAVAPHRIVPLWTLVTVASLSVIGSGIMLARERKRVLPDDRPAA